MVPGPQPRVQEKSARRGKGWRGRVEWVGLVKVSIKEAKTHSKTWDQCRRVESREGQAGTSTRQNPEWVPGAHQAPGSDVLLSVGRATAERHPALGFRESSGGVVKAHQKGKSGSSYCDPWERWLFQLRRWLWAGGGNDRLKSCGSGGI